MTSLSEAENEYCQSRCGEFMCNYGMNGSGKPCDLLMAFSRDFVGAD